jgi:hypothetical protein
LYILANLARASHRWCQLSSNVRLHRKSWVVLLVHKTQAALYDALRDDVAAVADPLFDLSKTLLQKYGNFLPHGLVLRGEGKDTMVGAIENNETGKSTSTQTLPLLHAGLRQQAQIGDVRAIGVAENVTTTKDGSQPTAAVKVLLEHRAGLCVALYFPFRKKFLFGYEFGTPFTVPAQPEVNPWAAP